MGNLLGSLRKIGTAIMKGYGKQIGRTSKSGLICFEKNFKGGKQYTLIEEKSGKLVRQKNIFKDGKTYQYHTTVDNKGNVISTGTIAREQAGFGPASRNQGAYKVRTIHEDYNRYGQVTNHRDVTFTPSVAETKATVFSNINGTLSKTYINTANNKKFTITCVE